MSQRARIVIALLAGLVCLGGLTAVASALTTDEARAQYEQNQLRLAQMRARIAAAKRQESKLAGAVEALDARLGTIDGKISDLQTSIDAVQAKLDVSEAQLAALREKLRLKRLELQKAELRLAERQRAFEQHMVDTYKSGGVSYIDVLMGSSGFEDLVTRVRFVNRIVAVDKDITSELTLARNDVAAEKASLAADTATAQKIANALEGQRAQLAGLRAALAAQRAAALTARHDKSKALAGVEKNRKAWEQQESQMAADSARLADIIRGTPGGSGGVSTGSLMWPVHGPVTSPFGWRVHPIFHVRKLHTGIDIGVGYGTPIHAADGGRVIYASWMGGYGNVIIIDHGGGLSTLYAHQSSLAVGYGAAVSRGQIVGRVGSTGFSTGPHLHFEVRVHGNPVNPMNYLP
jgi:murein DD-endopeptidase MepM/ murein hydrolase activator NlpD